jgi:CspA family cold shock protein
MEECMTKKARHRHKKHLKRTHRRRRINMSTETLPSQIAGERFIGQVKWFSEHKGYGFIDWQEDKDVFVHRSAIMGQGRKILEEGQTIEFGVSYTPRGPEAMNVIELTRGAERVIDHPEPNLQVSRRQAHRIERHQRDSGSARTRTGLFVYSYTIQRR